MFGHYLRDAGGMNPLAIGEPIVGIYWAARKIPAAPQIIHNEPVRANHVVEVKSTSLTPNILSWMAKRAS